MSTNRIVNYATPFWFATIITQCVSILAQTQSPAEKPPLPTPSPQQYVYHEQERIAFVALDPCSWQGQEYDNHSTPLDQIKLPKLDTDQWCQAAMAWGAKEILFVAKHTGGFCWWQTDTTDYSIKKTAWKNGKGDVLDDLARSCRKYGLSMGIYVYPGDESWGAGIGSGGKTKDPAKQEQYNKVFRQQLREAIQKASHHTPVVEVWFDGSCVIEVGDILKECAPGAVVFQGAHASLRWVGNEAGYLPYPAWNSLKRKDLATGLATAQHSNPDGDAWAPLEADTTLYNHNWFWSAANEKKRKSLDELMNVYYKSAGRGGTMLLNSTPNTDGLIPEDDVKRYRELGDEIDRRFARPIAETAGRGDSLEIDLGKPTLVNHSVVMEDYWFGERIRSYVIEGFADGHWKKLADGSSVGRKRIDFFDGAVVTKVRLRVVKSAENPLIRQFAVFHVTNFRPEPDRPARDTWTQCGAWNAADWKNGKSVLEVNLTPHIPIAGQYEVKFQLAAGTGPVKLTDEVLLQSGQESAPGVLTRREEPLCYNVNRTAVITKEADIRLKVSIEAPGTQGVLLIRPAQR